MNQLTRRDALRAVGTVALGAAAAQIFKESAWAHDLRPGDPLYRYSEYESLVNRPELRVRQIYEWPNINNVTIYPNVRNGLNGFQFSYDIPSELIQVVVQAYAGANPALYDNFIWDKYRFGESTGVRDPVGGAPATRNIWYSSTVRWQDLTDGRLPADRNHAFYNDVSIEGLQRRRVLFLV